MKTGLWGPRHLPARGNGALLRGLDEALDAKLRPYGVEHNRVRCFHARRLWSQFGRNFFRADLFESIDVLEASKLSFDLAIVMPGRLTEVGEQKQKRLRCFLRSHCDRVVAYAYADWRRRFGSLERLCKEVGLRPLASAPSNSTATVVAVEELVD